MSALSLCPACSTPLAAEASCCPTCCAGRRAGVASKATPAAMAALLGLSLIVPGCGDKEEGCGDEEEVDSGSMQMEYGGAATSDDDDDVSHDYDGDGYDREVDCDDGDETIHPGAEETPGDGVDSNCDCEDDT